MFENWASLAICNTESQCKKSIEVNTESDHTKIEINTNNLKGVVRSEVIGLTTTDITNVSSYIV